MTLDEAIIHAEEVANGYEKIKKIKAVTREECKCAANHRQLAEWLRELKQYKEKDTGISLKDITQVRLIEHLDEDTIARLDMTIGTLVAAENKTLGVWINTKDKLPDNKSYVLTTIKIPGRQPHVRSGWYQDGHFLNDNGDIWNGTDREVVGWQYQPEPMGKEQK